MTIASAESSFKLGLSSLTSGNPAVAATHFQDAVVRERQHGRTRLQMRYVYLSYYGLSLALAHGPTPHAIEACEIAQRRDSFNPDLSLNLSRVYTMAGKRAKAIQAIEHGLRHTPENQRLIREFAKLDRRQDPPLSLVSRNHPFNKWLGRLRAGVRPRPRAVKA